MNNNKIFKFLTKIKPTPEEIKERKKIIQEFISLLEKKLSKDIYIILGGSFAKDTWLKGSSDVDLFIAFSKEYKNKDISYILESYLKDLNLKYSRIPASRDYFKVLYKKICFELVPIIKIDNIKEATHISDVSPFHVNYVLKKIKEDPKLKDEIRIAKYFFKKWGIYGAETSVGGFSGYSLELLIIYYKSFKNLIRAASSWKPKVYIDIENHYPSFKEAMKRLNKEKTKAPIILIDPIDPERNAASSVTMRAFSKLILKSNILLKKIILNKKKIKYNLNIKWIIKNLEKDICGGFREIDCAKIKKLHEILKSELENKGFIVYSDKLSKKKEFCSYFTIQRLILPKYTIKIGPPIWKLNNLLKFVEKNKILYYDITEEGKLKIICERKIKDIYEFIHYFIKNYTEPLKNKYNICKILVFTKNKGKILRKEYFL